MKRNIIIIIVLLFSLKSFAQDSGLGLGVIIGEPTGLSAKMWTGQHTALDAAAAWSFVGSGFLRLHADMLIHSFPFDVDKGQLPVYFGLGAKLVFASDLGLGARVPFGIAYLFDAAPIDVFLEIVPGLDLLPATALTVEGAIGIRYFF